MLEEEIPAATLELENEDISFPLPLKVKAEISRITNAVVARLDLKARADIVCSRCLKKFQKDLDKKIQLQYMVESPSQIVDLNPDIRQEILLDYPIRFLCKDSCRGLCLGCGRNLNEDKCSCKTK